MIPEPLPPAEPKAPGCQSCGRSDETLRLVQFRYIFSLGILTFRRHFEGRWCGRHLALWRILAAAISLTFGWLGIPFGVLFTPLVMVQLARGGTMPSVHNGSILRAVAQDRLRKGDMPGARRCLEESLRFESDPLAEDQLKRLAAGLALDHPAGRDEAALPWSLVVSAALLAACALFGLLAGGLGAVLSGLIGSTFGENMSALQLLLYFMPRLLAVGLGAFAVQAGLRAALRFAKVESKAAALALGAAAGALFGYCFLSGGVLVAQWINLNPTSGVVPINRLFYDAALLVLRGPVMALQNNLAAPGLASFSNEAFTLVVLAYALYCTLFAALDWVKWRSRVCALVAAPVSLGAEAFGLNALGAVIASAAAVAVFAGAALLAPQQGGNIDDLQAVKRYNEGVNLFIADQPGPAAAAFEDAVRLNPSYADAYAALVRAYLSDGEIDKAEETARDAVERFPNHSDVRWAWGWVLYVQEQYEEAHHEMERAVEIDPTNHKAHAMLGWVDKARYQYAEAKGHFSDAIKLNPDEGEYYAGLGMAQYWLNEYDGAIRSLHDAINRRYDDESTRMTLLYSYLYSGKFDKLVEQSRDAAKAMPDSALVPAMMATAYYHLGNFEACEDQVKLSLERLPQAPDGDQQEVMWILIDIHRLDDVDREVTALLEGAEGCGAYCALLADLSAFQGKFNQGLAYADQVDNWTNSHAWASNLRADVLIQKGDWPGAAEAAQLALTYVDRYEYAMVNLATAAYALGDYDTALEQARAALELNPFSSDGYVALASALRAQGQTDEAITAARRAVELAPGNDEAHFILGLSLLDAGDKAAAKAELEQFQKFYWRRPYGEHLKAEADQAMRGLK